MSWRVGAGTLSRMRRGAAALPWVHDVAMGLVLLLVVADPLGARRRRAGWSAWLLSQQRLDAVMHRVAPPLLLTAVGTGAGSAIVAVRGGGRRSAVGRGVAALATVAGVRVTLAVNDPINQELRRWTVEHEPPDWRSQRARWEHGHRLRRVLLAGAVLATVSAHGRA